MGYINHTVPLPLGSSGLIGTRSPNVAGPTFLVDAESISFDDELVQKEGGAAKYNSAAITGTPSILAGHDWWPTITTQRMVVYTSAGALLKDDGTGTFATTLKGSLQVAPTLPPIFVEGGKEAAAGNRKLFVFNGYDPVQVLSADGATTANITTPPADWSGANQPSVGCIHENRLWGAGNANDPHRVYYSLPTDHEVFTGVGSGTISVYPGDGEAIIGMMSFKGLLIVWKRPRGVYVIDTSDASTANWRATRHSESASGVSPRGVVTIGNDVLFIDRTGDFNLVSAVQEYGNIGTVNLSTQFHMDSWMREHINISVLKKAQAIFYPAKREVHFALASNGGTTNNRRITIDFKGTQPRFRASSRDVCVSMWLRQDTNGVLRPMIGDNAGFVWHLDQTTFNKDSDPYACSFETAPTDLSYVDPTLAGKRKNAEFLELIFSPRGEWNVYVDVYWDNVKTSTVSYQLGGAGAVLGAFILSSNTLGAPSIKSIRKRITGSGRRVNLVVRNNGVGEGFALAGALLSFSEGDERA